MRLALNIVFGLFLGQAVWLPAQAQSGGAGIYTCVDAQGRRLTSDRPIVQCADREQRRRDAALLVRYPSRHSHDAERRNSLSQIESLQIIAQRRLLALERAHFQLQQELQFYATNPKKAPARLQADLQQSQASIEEQKTFMASQELEKRRVHQRFDAELERLAPLWASQ